MFVQIRRFDSDTSDRISCRSIKEDIDELKKKVAAKLVVHDPSLVRLFFDGKELQSGLTIFHYGIKLNHVIQVLTREPTTTSRSGGHKDGELEVLPSPHLSRAVSLVTRAEEEDVASAEVSALGTQLDSSDEISSDKFYSVGDFVDALHPELGAWFEATVRGLRRSRADGRTIYCVSLIKSPSAEMIPLELEQIRPQSWCRVPYSAVSEGDSVLTNFNLNQVDGSKKDERGQWFEALVTKKEASRRRLYGTVLIGSSLRIKDQRLRFLGELYAIHQNVQKDERPAEINKIISQGAPEPRITAFECSTCEDSADRRCTECSCSECGGKNAPEKQIICDECDKIYHVWCLRRPLVDMPPEDEDWYCPKCKNDDNETIRVRETQHMLKKSTELGRRKPGDWGRGMACVGRTRGDATSRGSSTDIFGPIPGVEVGTWWRFRVQASEAGLHTPLVSGICGKENLGASSIVVSCTYQDDIDLGEEIYYTGSGGKESRATARVGGCQTRDQELKRGNKALAMSCYAPFDDRSGADAKGNWRLGRPVRVLRSGNSRGAAKRSPYLPRGGVRYDGIYKVVRYWAQRSVASGHLVWRFVLRRDDQAPGPWTKEGKARLRRLGLLEMLKPDGWVDTKANGGGTGGQKRSSQPEAGAGAQKRGKKNLEPSKSLVDLPGSLRGEIICPICLDTLKNTMVTKECHHKFCQECIVTVIQSGSKECPTCRKKLISKDSLRPDPNFDVLISKLCPRRDEFPSTLTKTFS